MSENGDDPNASVDSLDLPGVCQVVECMKLSQKWSERGVQVHSTRACRSASGKPDMWGLLACLLACCFSEHASLASTAKESCCCIVRG